MNEESTMPWSSKGLRDIADERERHVAGEGLTIDHDNEHVDGSLALVASLYAKWSTYSDERRAYKAGRRTVPKGWPRSWDWRWWKPTDRRRDLVKAGALIVAELDRLDRE